MKWFWMITKPESDAIDALCRLKFDAFAQRAFRIIEPGISYEWNWHIGCIGEHLEAVFNDEISRLIINIPPRTLKSYTVAKAFPAWVLGKKPQTKFINTGYSNDVVEANSMGCRKIMGDAWYQHCFPQTRIDSTMDRNTHFTTTQAGQYYAATTLSSLTGVGCDYMILDDPIKPMEATSDTIRNSINNNIRTTLFSRFNNRLKGKLILVMQRVHEDDPTGNLLRDGGYTILKLPAEAKHSVTISLGDKKWSMEEGDLLFPQRLPRTELDKLIKDMTEYNYVGQYLQDPVPLGGGEFKDQWLQYYKPENVKPKEMNVCILVDASAGEEVNKKKRKSSDWTAMMVVGLAPDQNYYLLDIIRDRLNPTERIDMLFILHRKWLEKVGKPIKVGYEKYGMMADTHYIKQKMDHDGYRFPLVELGGSLAKENRIRRLIPDLQQMRWFLPENVLYTDSEGRSFDLVKELTESEMPSFPKARFDDMLDAWSRVYDEDMRMIFPALKSKKRSLEQETTSSWISY